LGCSSSYPPSVLPSLPPLLQTDLLVILSSQEAVNAFSTRAQISLGTELGIALGPLGRTAATDLHYSSSSSSSSSSSRRRRSRLGAGFSYGHSRGAFMGVSVEGSVLTARERVNQEFYGMKDVTVGGILSGEIPPPLAAFPLYKALEEVMGEGEGGREGGREACGTRWDSRNGMHGQQRSKTGRDGGEEGRQEEEEEDDGEDEEVVGLLRGMGGEMMTFQVMGE